MAAMSLLAVTQAKSWLLRFWNATRRVAHDAQVAKLDSSNSKCNTPCCIIGIGGVNFLQHAVLHLELEESTFATTFTPRWPYLCYFLVPGLTPSVEKKIYASKSTTTLNSQLSAYYSVLSQFCGAEVRGNVRMRGGDIYSIFTKTFKASNSSNTSY